MPAILSGLLIHVTLVSGGTWFFSRMGKLLDRLQANAGCYKFEQTGYGVVLIRKVDCEDEFTGLVKHLMDWGGDEFVVLPVNDEKQGYERVILLPF